MARALVKLGRMPFLSWAVFPVIGLCLYPFVWHGQYLGDDWHWIANVRAFGPGHFWIHGPYFRPIVSFYMWGADRIGGPVLLCVANVFLNVGSAMFIRSVGGRLAQQIGLGESLSYTLGWAAGLWFLCNSFHTEGVMWACCVNDTANLFFGLWGFKVLLRALPATHGKAFLVTFAGSLMLFAVAMLWKETALWYPVVSIFAVLLVLAGRRSGLRSVHSFVALVALAGLDVAYLLTRAHFLGSLVGGYGTRLSFFPQSFVQKHDLAVSLNNALIPLGRQISSVRFLGEDSVSLLTAAFFAGAALLWIRSMPLPRKLRDRVASQNGQRTTFAVGLVGLVMLGHFWVDHVYGPENEFAQRIGWAALFTLGLALVLLARKSLALSRRVAYIAICLAGVFSFLAAVTLPERMGLGVAVVLFAGVIELPNSTDSLPGAAGLGGFVILGLVSTYLLLILQMGIGEQYWGENIRLSYEASAFGALSCAGCLALYARLKPVRLAQIMLLAAIPLAVCLLVNEHAYDDAYKINNGLARGLAGIAAESKAVGGHSPHRIYLLAIPGPGVGPGANSELAWTTTKGTFDCRAAFGFMGYLSSDRIREDVAPGGWYTVRLEPLPSTESRTPTVQRRTAPDDDWFKIDPLSARVQIQDPEPGDVLATMDGDEIRVIRTY
jgi:hypothetical protein